MRFWHRPMPPSAIPSNSDEEEAMTTNEWTADKIRSGVTICKHMTNFINFRFWANEINECTHSAQCVCATCKCFLAFQNSRINNLLWNTFQHMSQATPDNCSTGKHLTRWPDYLPNFMLVNWARSQLLATNDSQPNKALAKQHQRIAKKTLDIENNWFNWQRSLSSLHEHQYLLPWHLQGNTQHIDKTANTWHFKEQEFFHFQRWQH